MATSTIPIISIKGYFSEDKTVKEQLIQQIRTTCEQIGFFIITDHGVDQSLIKEHERECFEFWHRVPQSLIISSITQSPFIWLDFCPNINYPLEEKYLKFHKEGFLLGPTQGRKGTRWQLDRHNLELLWLRYYQEMERLLKILMSLFALALDLDEHFFDDKISHHNHPLRSVFYPPVNRNTGDPLRAGEHTDWGCLTILKQDDKENGLEIKNIDGSWSEVPVIENTFVVNLGDLLPRWTNGRWIATAHRVVLPSTQNQLCPARMSIPFFGLVNEDTMIECIPSCISPNQSAMFPPILASSFFSEHEKYSVYNK